MKVEPVVLHGRHVRLEPLSREHISGLSEVGLDEELWRWIPVPVRTAEQMAEYVETALKEQAAGTALPFAQIEAATGKVIGQHALREHRARASSRGNRLDVDRAGLAAHRRQHRSEIPAAAACVRNAGLQSRGAEDRFAERKIPQRDPAHRRATRRHLPQPHDHCHRAQSATPSTSASPKKNGRP